MAAEHAGVPSCGVPEGKEGIYDPGTGIFHIRFKARKHARSAFEITKVAGTFAKPVVFRMDGVPREIGCLGYPLTLTVDGTSRPLESGALGSDPCDETLFHVKREGEAVLVAFTEKGQALLKPGAWISFKVDYGW